MWEFVDKAVYINLDHREDKRQIMQQFFEEGQIPSEKIERFSAIKHEIGILGSALSHITVLKRAKEQGWKNVLVLEDDAKWHNFTENYPKLENLVSQSNWDVCMLGGIYGEFEGSRIQTAVSSHAYIVNQHYYDTLLQNFEEGFRKKTSIYIPKFPVKSEEEKKRIYKKLVNDRCKFNTDVYWMILQEKDNWIGMIPSMCIQAISYSDNSGSMGNDFIMPFLIPGAWTNVKNLKPFMN